MRRPFFPLVLGIAIASASAAGCAAQQPGTQTVTPAEPVATALAVRRFREKPESFTQYSGLADSIRVVIRDSTTWARYWQAVNRPFFPAPQLPDVDFTREMVVLASMGSRPSAGYDIRVEGATIDSTRVTVLIRRVAPGDACAVAAVLTQPVDIVRLPATAAAIGFAERIDRSDCLDR